MEVSPYLPAALLDLIFVEGVLLHHEKVVLSLLQCLLCTKNPIRENCYVQLYCLLCY